MLKDYELKENMCIAIEPETSIDGLGMKLENMIVVRPGGGVSLNHAGFFDD